MNNLQVALDQKSYPLMMHLSITSKVTGLTDEQGTYNPETQTSTTSAMSGSWSTRSASSYVGPLSPRDDDSKEDD